VNFVLLLYLIKFENYSSVHSNVCGKKIQWLKGILSLGQMLSDQMLLRVLIDFFFYK